MDLLTKNSDTILVFLSEYHVEIEYNSTRHYADFVNSEGYIEPQNYPPDWPPPGLFFNINGLYASNQHGYNTVFDFFSYLNDLKKDLFDELKKNRKLNSEVVFKRHYEEVRRQFTNKFDEIKKCSYNRPQLRFKNCYAPEYKIEFNCVFDDSDKLEIPDFIIKERLSNVFSWLKEYIAEIVIYLDDSLEKTDDFEANSSRRVSGFLLENPNKDFGSIEKLLDSLKRAKLIHKKTKLAAFRSIFENRSIQNKIIWIGGFGDLKIFINTLMSEGYIQKITKGKWNTVIACFKIYDEADDTVKEMRQSQLRHGHASRNKELIKGIIQKSFI